MLKRGLLVSLTWLLASLPVWAGSFVTDDLAAQFDGIARDHITDAVYSDGSHVKAETPAERAVPLLPLADQKRVIEHGATIGLIESCGLEWKQAYIRFMANERAKKVWTPKQLAYMGMLHGIAQGFFYKDFAEKGCTADMKQALRQKLGQ